MASDDEVPSGDEASSEPDLPPVVVEGAASIGEKAAGATSQAAQGDPTSEAIDGKRQKTAKVGLDRFTVSGRSSVASTLWKENVYENDHRAVWGSWYDTEKKQWGYACCRGLERRGSCSIATKKPRRGGSQTAAPTQAQVKAELWSNPPDEFLARETVEFASPHRCAYVDHFVRYAVASWHRLLDNGSAGSLSHDPGFKMMFDSRAPVEQAEEALAPLLQEIQEDRAQPVVMELMDKMVSLAYCKEYLEAAQIYTEMTLGKKKWHNCLAQYAGSAQQNKGVRTYIVAQDVLLEYDKNPIAQKYMQCMRKLLYVAQCVRPNADPGKHFRS